MPRTAGTVRCAWQTITVSFPCRYTVSNLCGGYLATKYPPGVVLATGVAVWSLFTIATPYAASGKPTLHLWTHDAETGARVRLDRSILLHVSWCFRECTPGAWRVTAHFHPVSSQATIRILNMAYNFFSLLSVSVDEFARELVQFWLPSFAKWILLQCGTSRNACAKPPMRLPLSLCRITGCTTSMPRYHGTG